MKKKIDRKEKSENHELKNETKIYIQIGIYNMVLLIVGIIVIIKSSIINVMII